MPIPTVLIPSVGVALANLDLIEKEDFVGQCREKGDYLLKVLRQSLGDHPHVGDVRGLGLMCAVEYVKDKGTKEEFKPEEKVGPRIHSAAQEPGLFSRLRGDVFCLARRSVTANSIKSPRF